MDPNGSDALFEIIRKELNTIVEHGEKQLNSTQDKEPAKVRFEEEKDLNNQTSFKQASTSPRATTRGPYISKKLAFSGNDEEIIDEQKSTGLTGSSLLTRMVAGESTNLVTPADYKVKDTKLTEMQTKFKSTLEKDIANQKAFLDSPRTKSIDADLQRMQMELQDSYNLFQGISEKFESINFQNLQKRIKELNLNKKREAVGEQRSNELKQAVEEGFKANRLNEMTTKVGEKFSKHPGEFGNIPELSSFFQACTQLEHVLGNLKRQRTDVRNLEDRMRKSAEISYNRVNHIKKQLEEQEFDIPVRSQVNDN